MREGTIVSGIGGVPTYILTLTVKFSFPKTGHNFLGGKQPFQKSEYRPGHQCQY